MGYEQNITKVEGFTHSHFEERKFIERSLKQGITKTGIAATICRNLSSIKREIKRGSVVQRRLNPYLSKNGIVRRFIPKGSSFEHLIDDDFYAINYK